MKNFIFIIKRLLRDFCYPSDFFWINIDNFKEYWKTSKILSSIALIIYFILATIAFIGYYILLPFRVLHEWCEEWCYK